MSLVTQSELLAVQRPTGAYVVDTSFLLAAAVGADPEAETRYKVAFQLKRHLLKNQVGLFYTGVVRNELIHKLRESQFESAMDGSLKKYPKLKKLYRDAPKHDALKEVLKAGYVKSFEVAFGSRGKFLEKEHDAVTFGCTYIKTEEMKNRPTWETVFELMTMYGLDSSDAMILNYAIAQKTFAGLITMDSDFRFCSDVPNFTIVVPKSVIHFSPAVALS